MQPIEQQNLSARAYAALREALIAGHFGPGQRLVLHELAQTLGTSVTPVREACLTLVSEQALEMRLGRSVTVPELSLSRYIEIRSIRIALEGLASELAASRAQKADIAKLVRIQKEFRSANSERDSATATRLNREFHFGVYRLCGMDMLIRQIESMWICMGPILKLYHEQMADAYLDADEHVHIIDALRGQDGALAKKALERDLLRGGEGIEKYLAQMQWTENGKRVG